MYTCPRGCNYKSSRKANITRHLNRKKKCTQITQIELEIEQNRHSKAPKNRNKALKGTQKVQQDKEKAHKKCNIVMKKCNMVIKKCNKAHKYPL